MTYSYGSTLNGNYGVGRRTGMSTNAGTATDFTYDERGRLTVETKTIDGVDYTLSYDYRADDQLHELVYPDGEVVTYTYTAQGLVNSLTSNWYGTHVQETTYDAAGRLTQRRLGDPEVLQTNRYYYPWETLDGRGRLEWQFSGPPTDTDELQTFHYTYDSVGNVLEIEDYRAAGGTQTQTFTYDALDRVLSADVSGGSSGLYSETYQYDSIGNLTYKSSIGSYSYSASRPHAVTSAGSNSYSYDANGNMTSRPSYTLEYNAENRLTTVKDSGGSVVASFVYDGDGQRIKATFGGTTTYYIGNHYEDTVGSGATKYYYAGEERIGLRRDNYPSDNGRFWLLTDHLGSTAVTAHSDGSKKAELRYKAWGETRYDWGDTPTMYRFTGQREDATIGLYYYGARYYDAALGRFVQPDTIVPEPGNPQDLNRYAYVRNNPLRHTDPGGRAICIDADCDLLHHPVTQRPFLRAPAPPIITYTHGEMVGNAGGPLAWAISEANIAVGEYFRKGEFSRALGSKALALGLWTSQVMDARIKNYAGPLAPLLGNWDHKPVLMDEKRSPVPEIVSERPGKPRGWSTVGSRLYRFDIWSNIHYGYVGQASAFSPAGLTGGAGTEQIGSDLYNKTLPHRSPGAANWAASWDDPSDNAAIQVGIQLWNQYGLAVNPADLYLAVLEEPRLATQPLGGAR